MSFTGKVALVTGGASGMGRISAHRLAKTGAKVAIVDLNKAGLDETARGHDNIFPFVCDVSKLDEVNNIVQQITKELGPIDRLTHAAAIMPMGPLIDMPPAQTTKLMEINYFGTVYLVLAVLPSMLKRQGGDIIMFGSLAGQVIMPKMGAYSATKAAVNTFAEQLINEHQNSPVRIVLVCPPAVDTPLINQGLDAESKGLKFVKDSGRLADPNFIIDQVEERLAQGGGILYPGGLAKLLLAFRKFFPKLLWKVEVLLEARG